MCALSISRDSKPQNERGEEVRTMKNELFEITLLNESVTASKIDAREAESPCKIDGCLLDYCTPSGCTDLCDFDFSG
jgi:hypothetical protein